MAFRVHFTQDDLRRISLAEEVNPLSETIFSLRHLHARHPGASFGQWRRWAHSRIPRSVHLLRTLVPAPHGFSPDFLTPTGATDLEAGLDELLHTPKSFLRTDLAAFARLTGNPLPAWVPSLAEGDPVALKAVGGAVRDWHEAAVAPLWHHLHARFEATRSSAARSLLSEGLDGMLSNLHPTIRWTPPVLELACPDHDWDIHLGGRGLRLIPSFFIGHEPAINLDPALPPVVIYPVTHDRVWIPAPAFGHADHTPCDRLAALLGLGRAAVLEALSAAHGSTTELARRTGLSPATVSHHTQVLRVAGLITTHRTGASVRHAITSLGMRLMHG
ncbi:helix-turn-helix domain-containing protein [Streptomyces sp. NPDC019937]|uniref:ArsR/SmtB family transcription factor n=1 Tax=Streptomyces sp. NPDC019937 TaxID=3154787 RepID=UPI0033E978F1